MGKSGNGKRSKKSKRAKRAKAAERARLANREQAAQQEAPPHGQQPSAAAEPQMSPDTQALVIELQRTELSRLLREQQRLNDRVDQLLRLHEREQVLRQQMQAALEKLASERALPPPRHSEGEQARLLERLNRAEGKFAALQSAMYLLVRAIERRMAPAH